MNLLQGVGRYSNIYFFGIVVITRATKSQLFSAVLKVHETSTNKISHSYHEGIPSN